MPRRSTLDKFSRVRRLSRLGRADEITADLRATGRVFAIKGSYWPTKEYDQMESVLNMPDDICAGSTTPVVNVAEFMPKLVEGLQPPPLPAHAA
jgi:hypothetical protein